jgi:hypothetical protein
VNERQAEQLEGVLRERVPGGMVTVVPDDDARIVIMVNGTSHTYNVGDGPSALLNHLLTAYAD